MGRKRRDIVSQDFYSRIHPGYSRNNPNENEEILLQRMYERILSELAMNRFKWSGIAESMNERFMELQLLQNGLFVVFKDTGKPGAPGTDRIFALRGTPSGQRNMMDEPTSFTITGPGAQSRLNGIQLPLNKCVPVWHNYLRTTDWDIITTYSRKLAKVDRTIEINLDSARRTKVLVYDENTRLSAENINRMIDAGEPTIRVKNDLGQTIQALDLGVDPKSIETLSVVRQRFWSEAMGMLGINNANQDKKERLVESEVSANDDQVDNMRFVSLNSRQHAARLMRKMFPEELGAVSVEFRSDELQRRLQETEAMLGFNQGGGESGDIHP